MKKLLLITGDLAAGKSTFSKILSERYCTAFFQKDTFKEILGSFIRYQGREENKALSDAAIELMRHIFSKIAVTGNPVILESNFHENELKKLHSIAEENQYEVLTIVLRGDPEILYQRYLHRMKYENRHPVHLTTTLHIREDFLLFTEESRRETITGKNFVIDATDFSYQTDPTILKQIDLFMEEPLRCQTEICQNRS